jgi:dihydrolipoamide dehydrogenase
MIYDIAIIGGGPAGYVAAIKAAQEGAKTILFEMNELGGTCLNRGCIPTKTYLKTAEWIHSVKYAKTRGIVLESSAFKMDMDKVVKEKNKVVKTLTGGVGALLKSNGVEVVNKKATITPQRKIKADGVLYDAKNIIIATGSKAFMPPIKGADIENVITSDEILNIDYVPKNLVVIGGGVIGLEMSMVFSAFGSNVKIIELMDRVLPTMDKDISVEMEKYLKTEKIEVLTGVKVEEFAKKGKKVSIKASNGENYEADLVLVSIGRAPVSEDVCQLPLEKVRGFIKANEYLESSEPGIYVAGDVNGKLMLAHAGSKMGEIAVKNALGKRKRLLLNNIPSNVYTMLEIGSVGMTSDEAEKRGNISLGLFPFGANGRALASGEAKGFVKMIIDESTKEILGVHIVGPNAAEMINEAAALMEAEITAEELADTTHAHPTIGESLMEAAGASLGRCIHMPKR